MIAKIIFILIFFFTIKVQTCDIAHAITDIKKTSKYRSFFAENTTIHTATPINIATVKSNQFGNRQDKYDSLKRNLDKNHSKEIPLLILLHGLNKTSKSLKRMEAFAHKQGFKVLNIDYPSTKFSIENLVDIIHNKITSSIQKQKYTSISFCGISMGGLVIRAYLHKYRIANLGRVVLIGTPNKGSEAADYLKNNELYKRFTGPAGQQLTTNQENFNNIFGNVYYECGVIAGNLPFGPCIIFFNGKKNDGVVTIESTKIEGMQDHIVLNVSHWYLAKSKNVWLQTLHFLKYSKFQK
ncbi:alpha/beta hydrolase family protein [Orientia chuto str. Dubai]|uniref:Alpha/beta hydrolase family protein n=1 Tax=Orientia chuto str. Dubai TaxID=1359168 RepID=A0A0F3MHH9_9RICK|nr:lipase LipB [Candidatus Orientia mediorientalis]KJV55213.1 alpha/beta hydrolase family protein [Orientia chuto str. Dubai]